MPGGVPDEVPVDRESLSLVVRSALGGDAEPLDWTSSLVYAGYGVSTGSVQRISVTVRHGEAPSPAQWSAILKTLRPGGDNSEPNHPEYWRREAELYASGVQGELPDGLRAPNSYAVLDVPGLVSIWLEDLGKPPDGLWPSARYGEASRCVGQWNGAYLLGKSLPNHPWLTRRTIQQWGELVVSVAPNLEYERDKANVRRYWPGQVFDRAVTLRAGRARLYDVLDSLPQVLGHGDFHQGNLLHSLAPDGREEFVAIDWAAVGILPLGGDVARLVAFSPFNPNFDVENLPIIAEAAYGGYLTGLRESGWAGDERLARLGFTASAATLGGLATHGYRRHSPDRIPVVEQAWGLPYDELMDRAALTRVYCLALAEEARSLWHLV